MFSGPLCLFHCWLGFNSQFLYFCLKENVFVDKHHISYRIFRWPLHGCSFLWRENIIRLSQKACGWNPIFLNVMCIAAGNSSFNRSYLDHMKQSTYLFWSKMEARKFVFQNVYQIARHSPCILIGGRWNMQFLLCKVSALICVKERFFELC